MKNKNEDKEIAENFSMSIKVWSEDFFHRIFRFEKEEVFLVFHNLNYEFGKEIKTWISQWVKHINFMEIFYVLLNLVWKRIQTTPTEAVESILDWSLNFAFFLLFGTRVSLK